MFVSIHKPALERIASGNNSVPGQDCIWNIQQPMLRAKISNGSRNRALNLNANDLTKWTRQAHLSRIIRRNYVRIASPLMARSMRVKKNVDHAGVVLAHSKKDFALLRTAFERHARALSSDAAAGRDHMGLTPRYFPLHAHIASMTVISSFPALLNS